MEIKKDSCQICEKEFDRSLLGFITLGQDLPPNFQQNLLVCVECGMQKQLEYYKGRYELTKDSVEKLKVENNLFRTLMLKPETMEKMAGESSATFKLYISQHRIGWEQLSLDVILHWMELFECHAKAFASLANIKASKEDIKERIKQKSEEAFKQVAVKREEKVVTKAVSVKLTPFQKAVAGFIKNLNMTEAAAIEMVKKMMPEDTNDN